MGESKGASTINWNTAFSTHTATRVSDSTIYVWKLQHLRTGWKLVPTSDSGADKPPVSGGCNLPWSLPIR